MVAVGRGGDTPHSIRFTRYCAFSRGTYAQEPYQCRRWSAHQCRLPTFIVRKKILGGGMLVRDRRTSWDRMTPYEEFYKQLKSFESHGNRRVYQRMRGILPRERSSVFDRRTCHRRYAELAYQA